MDISSTPLYRGPHSHRYPSPLRRSPFLPSYTPAASPMSIPHAIHGTTPPPPLPPPCHIEELSLDQEPGWQWGNNPRWTEFGSGASVRTNLSLHASEVPGSARDGDDYALDHSIIEDVRRGSSITTVMPVQRNHEPAKGRTTSTTSSAEDSTISRPSSSYRLQSERQLEQRSLDTSSHAYDRNLLSKIGGPNTPTRGSLSLPGSAQDKSSASPDSKHGRQGSESWQGSLKPLTMPERRHPSLDSSSASRWTSISSGALSPGSFHHPLFDSGSSSRPVAQRHPSFTFDDAATHRIDSYDQSMFVHDDFPMENGQTLKGLNLNERSPARSDEGALAARACLKRRASSPHQQSTRDERNSLSSAAGSSDLYHRRSVQQLPNRHSPIAKSQPQHGSVSSASSYGPRHSSLSSAYGASMASSATSLTSGRLSPSLLSPAIDPELSGGPFHAAVRSLNPSPNMSLSQINYSRNCTEGTPGNQMIVDSPNSPVSSRQNSITNMQSMFICECCPKKPKKFSTEEELRMHHTEKQYVCAFCPNRFKNKNEAERHQNSLHLRKHSWSCSALAPADLDLAKYPSHAAFYPSRATAGATAICGYCGDEFCNPPDLEARREHLTNVHKFGECNQAKKFYRADHFRQHLKHSHAGTSGTWTTMLENACMKDEPPPIPMKDRGGPTSNPVGMLPTGPPTSVPIIRMPSAGAHARLKPCVIDEAEHEN